MKRWFSWVVAGVAAVIVLTLTTSFLTAEGSFTLVFGWIAFLQRTLPRITMDWISVSFSCAAFVLLAGGGHLIGRSFVRSSCGVWKLRWSIVFTALVAMMFAAGVASVGAIHQVGWMATSPEPTLVSSALPNWPVQRSSTRSLQAIGWEFRLLEYYDQQQLPVGGSFAEDGTMMHR
jgi:hypothetical protein